MSNESEQIEKPDSESERSSIEIRKQESRSRRGYLLVPFLFLTVTLLGGLRIGSERSEFIFVRPALFCLIAGAILLILFFRAGLLRLDGWLSDDFPMLKNFANGAVLASLFAASVQIFNSLIPETGIALWVVAFCFFWTLSNNLFAEFDTRRLIRSLGALFGLAFVVKYLILLNLTAPAAESWWQGMLRNPGKESVTWLFGLPPYGAATGYVQFFAVVMYLIGLMLMKPRTD